MGNHTTPRVWNALCYSVLIYFSILVLPFTILGYTARYTVRALSSLVSALAAHSGAEAPWAVPGLEHDSGCATPRYSQDWEREHLEALDGLAGARTPHTKHRGFLVGRKSRENSFADYDPCRLWDDDDGYNRYPRVRARASSPGCIIEVE